MDSIEQRIIAIIERNRNTILSFAQDIYTHGELGYKEYRTAARFKDMLTRLGLETIHTGLAITGVKGYLRPPDKTPGPALSLIGELDAIRIPNHRYANPETQAGHCCGHHAQLAGVIGAAYALTDPTVRDRLGGNAVFFGVPAEEYGEIDFKKALRSEGKIQYGGGKSELIRIGAFDDIALSIAHHSGMQGITVGNGSSNGFVSKVIRYHGRAAHAAAGPHLGINALYAAHLGLAALQCQRETFRDEDSVRIHPILTRGGGLVNVIPNEAVIETLVRAKTSAAIADADRKTDRSFRAGADAMGAGYRIETLCGYLPQLPMTAHPDLLAAADLAAPDRNRTEVDKNHHFPASTDVGDLQHIQPVVCFTTGGIVGDLHGEYFDVADEEEAYIITAKIFALSAYRLLKDNARSAVQTIAEYRAPFTKAQYLAFMDSMIRTEEKEIPEYD